MNNNNEKTIYKHTWKIYWGKKCIEIQIAIMSLN